MPRARKPENASGFLEEILLGAGLVLVVVGLWPVVGLSSFIVPGVVLLWLGLPARAPFVERPIETPPAPRRTS